jgi:hypothetical protein
MVRTVPPVVVKTVRPCRRSLKTDPLWVSEY